MVKLQIETCGTVIAHNLKRHFILGKGVGLRKTEDAPQKMR